MGDTAEHLSKLVLVNSKERLVEGSINSKSYLLSRLSRRAHSPKGIFFISENVVLSTMPFPAMPTRKVMMLYINFSAFLCLLAVLVNH